MAEYIDRDHLIEGLVSNDPVRIAAICEPVADVAPVVHARWVFGQSLYSESWLYRCTNCDGYTEDNPPYCSNCGAKMDGKEQDDE